MISTNKIIKKDFKAEDGTIVHYDLVLDGEFQPKIDKFESAINEDIKKSQSIPSIYELASIIKKHLGNTEEKNLKITISKEKDSINQIKEYDFYESLEYNQNGLEYIYYILPDLPEVEKIEIGEKNGQFIQSSVSNNSSEAINYTMQLINSKIVMLQNLKELLQLQEINKPRQKS